jgi:dienelactone hydrolase
MNDRRRQQHARQSSAFAMVGTCRRWRLRDRWCDAWIYAAIMAGLLAGSLGANLHAAGPRVLPEGKLPADARLAPPKDLDGYFPFAPSSSVEQWNRRATVLRRQMQVALGLWPMPQPTPLRPVVHGKVERDGYTVERAYFESFPGFYVTGSLYRPTGKSGKLPVVLCPHGHWADGRFHDMGRDAVRREIVNGAERFEEGGRSPLQARSVQLARMGCIVFFYDMIGYADSKQLSFELAHGFAKQRPEMNSPNQWGLYSPQAESRLQSVMGLQTYNSIRTLDFVASLPDVDMSRVAVTGASGGGTQTMILGALDPRPSVIFPAVMVSTAMQGGCTCENCSLLRIETGNVEFAALFAPKPQALSAADDWTREMQTKGFPELKRHYQLLGAPDHVSLKATIHFGHNYNYVNRAAMYSWFNQHLKLGLPEPIVEEDYKRLSREEMTVWDATHPAPPSGPELERNLLRHWHEDAERQLAAAQPRDAETLAKFRDLVGGGWQAILGRELPAAKEVALEQSKKLERDQFTCVAGLLRNQTRGEELPIAFLQPKSWNGRVVVWLSASGKSGLFQDAETPRKEVAELLAQGIGVLGVDLLYQGEFLADGKPLTETPRVRNPREFAGYTWGYNHTIFARRVHDVLNVLAYVRGFEKSTQRVDVVALDETAAIAIAARALARDAVDSLIVDTQGFRFASVRDLRSPNFLPGGAKYGDLPGLLALGAPGKVWIAGEGAELPGLVRDAYAAAGSAKNLGVLNAPIIDALK